MTDDGTTDDHEEDGIELKAESIIPDTVKVAFDHTISVFENYSQYTPLGKTIFGLINDDLKLRQSELVGISLVMQADLAGTDLPNVPTPDDMAVERGKIHDELTDLIASCDNPAAATLDMVASIADSTAQAISQVMEATITALTINRAELTERQASDILHWTHSGVNAVTSHTFVLLIKLVDNYISIRHIGARSELAEVHVQPCDSCESRHYIPLDGEGKH